MEWVLGLVIFMLCAGCLIGVLMMLNQPNTKEPPFL